MALISIGHPTMLNVEIDASPVKVVILNQADKSDPLDQLLVVGFRIGGRLFGRASVVKRDHPKALEEAIAALLIIVAEHAAEFRDAIAMER